jgi:hypothetical protein
MGLRSVDGASLAQELMIVTGRNTVSVTVLESGEKDCTVSVCENEIYSVAGRVPIRLGRSAVCRLALLAGLDLLAPGPQEGWLSVRLHDDIRVLAIRVETVCGRSRVELRPVSSVVSDEVTP